MAEKKAYKYGSEFKVIGSRTKKTEEKPVYKPKRGPNDGSGFTVN